ncbi:uncharacterized protein YukE [Kitasatospora sp. GAS204A]|uniref:WXG100 family type VII secretion target n=1 Tax=unclassified Kitasatospora TaxID=2633591 RepID=UPI0024743E78|nr:hypothetical protein [Kitasatospora sp. GAS204B]MDH6117955.1 uncharacterized protein YukE [Kitasatospora sp. GAS204B]
MPNPSVDDGPHDWFAAKSHQELLDMVMNTDTGVISTRGGALRGASSTLTEISAQLKTNVQNLEWTGAAADSFRDWAGKLNTATNQLSDYAVAAAPPLEAAATALGTTKAMPPVPTTELDTLSRYASQGPPLSPPEQAQRKMLDPTYVTTQEAQAAQAKVDTDHQDAVAAMTSLASAYDESTSQLKALTPPLFPPTPTSVMGPPPPGQSDSQTRQAVSYGGGGGGSSYRGGGTYKPPTGPGPVRNAPVQPGPPPPVHGGPTPPPIQAPPIRYPVPPPVTGPTPPPIQAPPITNPVVPPSTGIDHVVPPPTLPPQGTVPGGPPPQGGPGGGNVGGPGGFGGLPGGSYPGGRYPGGSYPSGSYPGGSYPGGSRPYGGLTGTGTPNLDEGISGGVGGPGAVSGRSQLGANAIGAEEGGAGAGGRGAAGGMGGGGGGFGGGRGGVGGGRGGVGGGIGRNRGLVSAEGGEVGGSRGPGAEGEFTPGGSGLRARAAASAEGEGGAAGHSGMMPGGMGQAGKRKKDRRNRADYLVEDEETWVGGTPGSNPDVIG